MLFSSTQPHPNKQAHSKDKATSWYTYHYLTSNFTTWFIWLWCLKNLPPSNCLIPSAWRCWQLWTQKKDHQHSTLVCEMDQPQHHPVCAQRYDDLKLYSLCRNTQERKQEHRLQNTVWNKTCDPQLLTSRLYVPNTTRSQEFRSFERGRLNQTEDT